MTSYIVGRVVEPSVRKIKVKGEDRQVCSLGLLCIRECTKIDVFDDSDCFDKVVSLEDGDEVVALVGTSFNRDDKFRVFLNDIGYAPEGFRQTLVDMMADTMAE